MAPLPNRLYTQSCQYALISNTMLSMPLRAKLQGRHVTNRRPSPSKSSKDKPTTDCIYSKTDLHALIMVQFAYITSMVNGDTESF
ncbi:hypothetical protein AAFC00_005873 [Neodothiora populina]